MTSLNPGNFCFDLAHCLSMHLIVLLIQFLFYGKHFLICKQDFFWKKFYRKCALAFSIFRVVSLLNNIEVSDLSFVISLIQVFCKNTQNGSWYQIHLLGKKFFAYSKGFEWFEHVPHSPHFLCEWTRWTGSWMIVYVACFFEKFFNAVNITFVHF